MRSETEYGKSDFFLIAFSTGGQRPPKPAGARAFGPAQVIPGGEPCLRAATALWLKNFSLVVDSVRRSPPMQTLRRRKNIPEAQPAAATLRVAMAGEGGAGENRTLIVMN